MDVHHFVLAAPHAAAALHSDLFVFGGEMSVEDAHKSSGRAYKGGSVGGSRSELIAVKSMASLSTLPG